MGGDAAITLIGVPYSLGERNVSMGRGPTVLLEDERLAARLRALGHDVEVRWVDRDDAEPDEGLAIGDVMTKHLVQNRQLAELVAQARAAGRAPIVLAGNCSSSIGVASGVRREGFGLVWIDAHPDSETPETSITGLFDGMPVATIAGRCWKAWREQIPGFRVVPEDRIVTVGLHERHAPADRRPYLYDAEPLGTPVDPPAVARKGFDGALGAALDELAEQTDAVYLHVDVDVLDPREANASRYTAEGGLSVSQVVAAIEAVGRRFDVLATSFADYDPDVDPRMAAVMARLVEAAAGIARAPA
ncbi:MAG: arginase family protein [Solirubrobacteraceae bacterium]|nr:arginase family protein [Solirubrobacteraceae bacterium]